MPRKHRVQYPGAIYHVFNRGIRKANIVFDDHDRSTFCETLAETCAKTQWRVHAYALLSNHFHLVVETPLPNLSTGMKWFLSAYAARFNCRHELSGPVFNGRYRSKVVAYASNGYLKTVCDYVHLNPARANLIGLKQPLRSYHWSSWPLYLKRERPTWLEVRRLMAEHQIRADNSIGRQILEKRLENKRKEAALEQTNGIKKPCSVEAFDFDWEEPSLESERSQFPISNSYIDMSDTARAEAIIQSELIRIQWTEANLQESAKTHFLKIGIAKRLREETTSTYQWIVNRLNIGSVSSLKRHLGKR